MKRFGIGTLALCGFAALGTGLGGCGKSGSADKQGTADSGAVSVIVSKISMIPFEDWGSYSADLRGIEDANLTAPMQGGRVNSINSVGTTVKAGQALCNIDGEKYEAALQAATAQVEVAKGDLERARINVEKGSLGKSAVDAANLVFQNARMNLATAQRAYEDSRCEAPFDGILVSRYIERYQTVTPGVPTLRVSRADRLEAVISIPETDAFSYTEGMKAEFRLLQNPDHFYAGRVTSLDRAVDPHSRTATARIEIINKDGALKPGMVGRARILRRSYAKGIVIPSSALVRLQDGISVMVVENGLARQRIVEVGAATADSSLISKGLKIGDQLIVTGAFQVSNGTKVRY